MPTGLLENKPIGMKPWRPLWESTRGKRFGNKVFQELKGVQNTLVEASIALESSLFRVAGTTDFHWINGLILIVA
jgi:hypothetical protein